MTEANPAPAETWIVSDTDQAFYRNPVNEFPTKEAAITHAQGLMGSETFRGWTFWVGRIVEVKASDFWRLDLDDMDEMAFESCGEASSGWPYLKPEEEAELQARMAEALDQWFTENTAQPTFFRVEDIERVDPLPSAGDGVE